MGGPARIIKIKVSITHEASPAPQNSQVVWVFDPNQAYETKSESTESVIKLPADSVTEDGLYEALPIMVIGEKDTTVELLLPYPLPNSFKNASYVTYLKISNDFGSDQHYFSLDDYTEKENPFICECSEQGSKHNNCTNSGQCPCWKNFDGQKCDKCNERFENYPKCHGLQETYIFKSSNCSTKCGTGTKTETLIECREVVTENKVTLVCDKDTIRTTVIGCENKPCKGTYGDWSDWSACSKTCLKTYLESSHRNRSRNCLSYDQSLCNGLTEVEICQDVKLCSLEGNTIHIPN